MWLKLGKHTKFMATKLPTQLHAVSLLVTDSDTATVKRKRARQEHVQISVSNYNTLTWVLLTIHKF